MPHSRYHVYGTLDPEARGHQAPVLLGAEAVARTRPAGLPTLGHAAGGGQAVRLKAFRRPWTVALSDTDKELWRSTRHPGLLGFLRTEPSIALGTCYAYYHYEVEPLTTAADAIRDRVGYQHEWLAQQFAAVADALHEVAEQGLNHGAITPESIVFLPADGTLRVKDFGLRLRAGDELERYLPVLEPVLPFLAPEIINDAIQGQAPTVTTAADIYAFGATLQFAATGRVPVGEDLPAAEAMLASLSGEVKLAASWSHLPVLAAVIERCLANEPDDRYQSFAELARDLRRASVPLIPRGEDEWGLRFEDARGQEVRVFPPCLTLSETVALEGAGAGESAAPSLGGLSGAESRLWLRPRWVIDSGSRTVVCTAVRGLEPLGARTVAANVWEYHLALAFAELHALDGLAPLVVDLDHALIDAKRSRLMWLYPSLVPRPGYAQEFLELLGRLDRSPTAPEILELAHAARAGVFRGQAVGETADPDGAAKTGGNGSSRRRAVVDVSASASQRSRALQTWAREAPPALERLDAKTRECAALCATSLALYQALTGDRFTNADVGREPASAFMAVNALSVTVSRILDRCMTADPCQRTASARLAFEEYQAHQRDPGSRRMLARASAIGSGSGHANGDAASASSSGTEPPPS